MVTDPLKKPLGLWLGNLTHVNFIVLKVEIRRNHQPDDGHDWWVDNPVRYLIGAS